MKYQEIRDEQPVLWKCFFAFSNEQFAEGKEKAEIGDEPILRAYAGLFGTKQGIDRFFGFYADQKVKIGSECDPQEVYNYEYGNHECGYVGDDSEAINLVVHYFGIEKAKQVVRKHGYKNL